MPTSSPCRRLRSKARPSPSAHSSVTAPGHRRSRLEQERALSPFVGREREIATLREALEEALAGRGQVVGIVGEPGVGKSRVLYEFRRLLAERDVAYLEGWCQSFGQSIPYLPLQDVLRAVCGIEDSDTPAQVAQRVQAASGKLGLSPQDDAPYLLRLLGARSGRRVAHRAHPRGDPGPHPRSALARDPRAGAGPSARGGNRGPALDRQELGGVPRSPGREPRLARRSCCSPPAAPATRRRGSARATPRRLRCACSRPMRAGASSRPRLHAPSWRTQLPRPSCARRRETRCSSKSSPLRSRGMAPLAAAQPLPDTIQGVLAARIDRLPEQSKRTLQTASVLGREFPLRLLEEVSQDRTNLESQLAALKQLEFVYDRSAAEGPVYTFKHVLDSGGGLREPAERPTSGLARGGGAGTGAVLSGPHRGALRGARASLLAQRRQGEGPRLSRARQPQGGQGQRDAGCQRLLRGGDAGARLRCPTTASTAAGESLCWSTRCTCSCSPTAWHEFQRYLDDLSSQSPKASATTGCSGTSTRAAATASSWLGLARKAAETLTDAAALCERAGNFQGAGHAYAHLQWAQLQKGEYEDVLRARSRSSALARAGAGDRGSSSTP